MTGVVDFSNIRFGKLVERVHRLGPRALSELFLKLGAQHLLMTEIEAAVAEFAAVDPEVVVATGGDCMPPTPLHLVSENE